MAVVVMGQAGAMEVMPEVAGAGQLVVETVVFRGL